MINITPKGYKAFTKAITSTLRSIHLFTDQGELTGHGYKPKDLIVGKWDGGVYPDVTWEFTSGDPVTVLGYYVSDGEGMLFSEPFTAINEGGARVDAPMEIKNNGDRITVGVRLNLLEMK